MPEIALLKSGLSKSLKIVSKSPVSVLFKIFGLKSGELTRAFINPVFGFSATTAPFLPVSYTHLTLPTILLV